MTLTSSAASSLTTWLSFFSLFHAAESAYVARGTTFAEIVVKSGYNSKAHPLHSTENITIWCEVLNDRSGATSSALTKAQFIRQKDNKHLDGTVDESKKKAYVRLGALQAEQAGNYSCEMTLRDRAKPVVGYVEIFIRPVVNADEQDRYDASERDPFDFNAKSSTVLRRGNVTLACPIIAVPKASISWSKDNTPITPSERIKILENGTLEIRQVTESDRGEYTCNATNKYGPNGNVTAYRIIIRRRLHVRSEVAWVWPLAAIVVIILLLLSIIFLCELRKKRIEAKKSLMENEE